MKTGQRITSKEFLNSELAGLARMGRERKDPRGKNEAPSQSGNKVKNKYGNKKTTVDGIAFDSKWEAERYCELKTLERVGDISDLDLQVPYKLRVNGMLICTYKADFVYQADGKTVVEDAKGVITKEYALKRKLMKAIYGIEIFESKKKKTRSTT